MNTTAASLQERRRQALARLEAGRRNRPSRPWRIDEAERVGPPTTSFYVIAVVLTVFVMLGLVMVLSASATSLVHDGKSPYYYFVNQLLWACTGVMAIYLMLRIPYNFWRRLSIPLLLVGMAGMALPFVSGVGLEVNGARAWIKIGPFSMQPAEFLKLAVVIAVADLLTRRVDQVAYSRRVLVPIGALAAVGAGACLVQEDLGTAIVLSSIVVAIAFIGGVPVIPLTGLALSAASFAALFVLTSERRLARFTAFTDIKGNKDYLAYQTWQGYLSIANGGVFGSGIGEGKGKLGYLPLAHSDFIFAVIADELGLIGAIAVLGGFGLLVWFGIQTALAARDRFGMLLAGGISVWFAVQTVVNVGGVTGLMPVTGLTLPFFSAGGTSLLVSMIAAGLLLNVARRAH
jgi:cell division protein FtsW